MCNYVRSRFETTYGINYAMVNTDFYWELHHKIWQRLYWSEDKPKIQNGKPPLQEWQFTIEHINEKPLHLRVTFLCNTYHYIVLSVCVRPSLWQQEAVELLTKRIDIAAFVDQCLASGYELDCQYWQSSSGAVRTLIPGDQYNYIIYFITFGNYVTDLIFCCCGIGKYRNESNKEFFCCHFCYLCQDMRKTPIGWEVGVG